MAGSDTRVRFLCGVLWLVLLLSFAFLLTDFILLSSYKKDYRELNHVVHSDPVAGIANRFSCDALIDRYLDKPLPDHMGCIMFDLTNLRDINRRYGHMQGNILIRDFSNILHLTSLDLCFVGVTAAINFWRFSKTVPRRSFSFFLTGYSRRRMPTTPGRAPIPLSISMASPLRTGRPLPLSPN